jgi:hypothetical protein
MDDLVRVLAEDTHSLHRYVSCICRTAAFYNSLSPSASSSTSSDDLAQVWHSYVSDCRRSEFDMEWVDIIESLVAPFICVSVCDITLEKLQHVECDGSRARPKLSLSRLYADAKDDIKDIIGFLMAVSSWGTPAVTATAAAKGHVTVMAVKKPDGVDDPHQSTLASSKSKKKRPSKSARRRKQNKTKGTVAAKAVTVGGDGSHVEGQQPETTIELSKDIDGHPKPIAVIPVPVIDEKRQACAHRAIAALKDIMFIIDLRLGLVNVIHIVRDMSHGCLKHVLIASDVSEQTISVSPASFHRTTSAEEIYESVLGAAGNAGATASTATGPVSQTASLLKYLDGIIEGDHCTFATSRREAAVPFNQRGDDFTLGASNWAQARSRLLLLRNVLFARNAIINCRLASIYAFGHSPSLNTPPRHKHILTFLVLTWGRGLNMCVSWLSLPAIITEGGVVYYIVSSLNSFADSVLGLHMVKAEVTNLLSLHDAAGSGTTTVSPLVTWLQTGANTLQGLFNVNFKLFSKYMHSLGAGSRSPKISAPSHGKQRCMMCI